jgi:elongator complex protein 3
MLNLITDIKAGVPEYVRISRVLRDIPSKFIIAGLKDSLRDIVKERMKRAGTECVCIRCREYGHRVREGRATGDPVLTRMDYDAAGGKEIFLSFVDTFQTLYGLLRLRIQPQAVPGMAGGNRGSTAIIRELHVFGPEVPLSEQRTKAAQHKGYGKALLHEAERIAKEEFKAEEIYVLSGAGAKDYYRTESDYQSKGNFMVKGLQ